MLNIFHYMFERAQGCNSVMLIKLVKNSGKSVRKIAEEIGVSPALLWRLQLNKYHFIVKECQRLKICDHFNVDEDVLFPFVGANRGKVS